MVLFPVIVLGLSESFVLAISTFVDLPPIVLGNVVFFPPDTDRAEGAFQQRYRKKAGFPTTLTSSPGKPAF